jgi:nucleotide-binding universal stress UspA family protein
MREENLKKLDELQQVFRSIAGDGQNASWRQFEDRPTRALLVSARSADLLVSGTPGGASTEDTDRSVDPGILVCGAGRPVVLVADKVKFRRPQNAVVGWKDTTQSRRALADALPFLRMADNVLIVTINDRDSQDHDSDLADVAQYLTGHGITARSEVIEDDGKAVDQFVDIATREKADLLVSGAYGHSRLRELVFGGFTRALLNEDGFNRLMAS